MLRSAPLSPWGRARERVFALAVRGKPRSGVEEKNPLTLPAIRRAARAGREAPRVKPEGGIADMLTKLSLGPLGVTSRRERAGQVRAASTSRKSSPGCTVALVST